MNVDVGGFALKEGLTGIRYSRQYLERRGLVLHADLAPKATPGALGRCIARLLWHCPVPSTPSPSFCAALASFVQGHQQGHLGQWDQGLADAQGQA